MRFVASLLLLVSAIVHADARSDLRKLFDDEWERGLRENPINASFYGDNRYGDKLPDASLEAIAASQAADNAALAKLKAIDRSALPPADQLNYDTFQWQLE